jgi:hypothetical protein
MKFKEDDNRLNQTTYEPHKLNISVGRFPGGHDERPQNDLGTSPKKRVQDINNKAAYQMTKDEYVKKEMSYKRKHGIVGSGRFGGAQGLKAEAEKMHKIMVKDALSKDKTVPPEVLADYPDLTMKKETLGTPVGGYGHPITAFTGIHGYQPKPYDQFGIKGRKRDKKSKAKKALELLFAAEV